MDNPYAARAVDALRLAGRSDLAARLAESDDPAAVAPLLVGDLAYPWRKLTAEESTAADLLAAVQLAGRGWRVDEPGTPPPPRP